MKKPKSPPASVWYVVCPDGKHIGPYGNRSDANDNRNQSRREVLVRYVLSRPASAKIEKLERSIKRLTNACIGAWEAHFPLPDSIRIATEKIVRMLRREKELARREAGARRTR